MLTDEQKKIHDSVIDWFNSVYLVNSSREQILTLGGYAGTGKTYLIGYICNSLKKISQERSGSNLPIAFVTFTGKASTVLASKVREFMTEGDYCGTIHGFMYSLIGKDEKTRELYFEKNEGELDYALIIIDEASMVNQSIFQDLKEYGIPILAVGDHGQLPPVKGSFNLMEKPELKLETIIRQEEGNPIIKMARLARETGNIEYGDYGQGCIKTRKLQVLHDHMFDDLNSIMLCALNQTRVRMNHFARERLGYKKEDLPQTEEPVICLFNNRRKFIFNGQIGVLKDLSIVDEDIARATIDMGDYPFVGNIDLRQFGQKYLEQRNIEGVNSFDWAYCVTVWKSQGSEWNNVLLFEEYIPKMDDDIRRRFLYTACTRAREKLIIFKR